MVGVGEATNGCVRRILFHYVRLRLGRDPVVEAFVIWQLDTGISPFDDRSGIVHHVGETTQKAPPLLPPVLRNSRCRHLEDNLPSSSQGFRDVSSVDFRTELYLLAPSEENLDVY